MCTCVYDFVTVSVSLLRDSALLDLVIGKDSDRPIEGARAVARRLPINRVDLDVGQIARRYSLGPPSPGKTIVIVYNDIGFSTLV